MPSFFPPSELILNPDGSIYHLNLLPEDIGEYVITVGDPDRVGHVSRHFDTLELKKGKREFVTHTGMLGKRRITVLSTGIGPDNIDIVLNELDALVNIDLTTRMPLPQLRRLKIIRLGTSGCVQPAISVDSIVCSAMGLGFDNMLNFYDRELAPGEQQLAQDWQNLVAEKKWALPMVPYPTLADEELLTTIGAPYHQGITITAPGFYAPQGRQLRATSKLQPVILDQLHHFQSQGFPLINVEMETAAIYGLSQILGHQALSCSLILANRANHTFSNRPKAAVDEMIQAILTKISEV
ncbi:MAG: phosphorylase [Bacteroidetes bacterium]|nr:MAG: phosphorylase [Bacteroidota bacterium]PTM13834.1 MAG: phosphorylase [Bacteroidota bacterium]